MNRTSRRLAAPALAMAVAVSLAACNGQSTLGGSDPQPSGSPGKVNLTMWAFDPEPEFLPEVKAQFEASHPGVTISITQIPEDQYVTKLTTAFVAGKTPDIGAPYEASWLKSGKFVSVDDTLKAANVPLSDVNPAILSNCQVDGVTYCFGSYAGAVALFYNKDMFDAAGLPYPSSTVPMTIDQYATTAAALSKGSITEISKKVFGGSAPVPFYWMSHELTVGPDGRRTVGVVDSPRTAHVYDTLGSMVSSGSAPSDAVLQTLGGATADSPDLVAQGKQAMVIADNVTAIPVLEKAKIRYGVAPNPVAASGDLPFVAGWTDVEGVFAGSKHQKEALQFIAFLATQGNVIRGQQGAFPLRRSIVESSGWATKGDAKGRTDFLALYTAPAAINYLVPGLFEWTAPLSDVLAAASRGKPAQPELTKVAPVMQSDLDAAWEQYDNGK
jgi:multiple sugar transport system substrate-binding protein